tara:strand:+ start:61 stop:312 length:252 start_codon:yes stop_codon:yes gene_type:complete
MATSDTYNRDGIKIRSSFVKFSDDEDLGESYEPGFINDLQDYDYNVVSIDTDNNEGDVWFWVTDSSDINTIKSHSSFVSVLEE